MSAVGIFKWQGFPDGHKEGGNVPFSESMLLLSKSNSKRTWEYDQPKNSHIWQMFGFAVIQVFQKTATTPLNNKNQRCWGSRKFLQRLMVCVSLIGTALRTVRESPKDTLTVRPSLFLPPSVYKLPSFGSGRNAGLGFKQQLKMIKKRSTVLLREQESNCGQYQLSREVHLTPSNTVCFDFVLPNQTKPGSIKDKEQLSELSNFKREMKVLTQIATPPQPTPSPPQIKQNKNQPKRANSKTKPHTHKKDFTTRYRDIKLKT